MNTLDAIMSRRSIRQYKEEKISQEDLNKILAAAMQAPSAGDGRPWHFVVVEDRKQLDEIAEKVDQGNEMFKQAQAAIIVCGDESKEGFPGFYPQDCACASQNIYLAAHELGLATVWIALWGVPPRIKGIREVTLIPEEITPVAIFPLGYGNEDLGIEDRFDVSRVHRGTWKSSND